MKRNRNIREANEPGVDVFNKTGINKKLNNLMGFDDFEKTFEPKRQKATKRTDVGLDIINEYGGKVLSTNKETGISVMDLSEDIILSEIKNIKDRLDRLERMIH
jgi:hypothetical protein